MPNRGYLRGKSFERDVAEHLESLGYHAILSPGSKGEHKIDVTAVNLRLFPEILLVQCKTNGVISLEEWNAVYGTAVKTRGFGLLARRPRPGMIEFLHIQGMKIPNKHMQNQPVAPCPGLDRLPKRERDKKA